MAKPGDMIGAIDVGSNAVRFTLFKLNKNLDPIAVERKRFPVRLGAGVFKSGELAESDMAAAIDALATIAAYARENHVISMPAVATSAVRDSANQTDFLQRVISATGIDLLVISGETEARMAALGAGQPDKSHRERVIVDIGGGSTEVALFDPASNLEWSVSLPMGAVRMSEKWGMQNSYEVADLMDQRNEIRRILLDHLEMAHLKDLSKAFAIAMGGTARACMDMAMFLGFDMQSNRLTEKDITQLITRMATTEVPDMPAELGIQRSRAPIILAGTGILHVFMVCFNIKKIQVTDAGIAEGLVRNVVNGLIKPA